MDHETQLFNYHVYTVSDEILYENYDYFLQKIPQNMYPFNRINAYGNFPPNVKFNESFIIYLKYLIIKEKLFESMCLYKFIWMNRWITKVPIEIRIRLMLMNESTINDGIMNRKSSSLDWVDHFFDKGFDKNFKANVTEIFSENTLIMINTKCSACNNAFPVSLYQKFVEKNDHFLCPVCMANIIYSRDELRIAAKKYFNSELLKLPLKQPEEYSEKTINKILNIARTLKTVSSIRFGVFRVDGAHLIGNSIFFDYFKRIGNDDSGSIDYFWTEADWIPWNSFALELNLRFFKYMHPIVRSIVEKLPNNDPMNLSRKILHPPFTGIFFHTKKSKKIYRSVVKEFFSFTTDEIKKGENELKKMGISPGEKYACLTYRSDKYHKDFSLKQYSRPYNQYIKSSAHRNAKMESIKCTIKRLSDSGYYVLLMGKESPPEDLLFEYDKYIIYSRDFRTEFLDMYLFFHSNIVVGLGGSQAFTFGLMRDNCLALDIPDIWLPECVYNMTLSLPKHIYSEKKNRLLSPKERILTTVTQNLNSASENKERYIDNSNEDIEKTIDEFIEIIEGRKNYSLEMNNMHKIFYSYYQLTPLTHKIDDMGGRISSCFFNCYEDEILSSNY